MSRAPQEHRQPDLERQAEMLGNRLKKNRRRLRGWVSREEITCYRLYDKDIPEIPLAIDWYDGRLHIAEYAHRASESLSEPAHRAWIDRLAAAAAAALDVDPADLWVKRRQRQRGKSQYERLARARARFLVREGGAVFWVNLSDYLDTGLFLDHRPTRLRVGAESVGRDVLNLFAYTGAFSVHAARGGARSTTSVDMSRTYLDWAADNFEANGLRADGRVHRLLRSDVRAFLREASAEGRRWDLIVCDPPTFSNSKRTRRHFDVQRDHGALLRELFRVLRPEGVVYFSTNARRFKLDAEALPGANVEDITEETIPPDFRDRRIHRCFRLTRRRRRVAPGAGRRSRGA